MKHPTRSKKQCLGNRCQLDKPDCKNCKIDEELKELERKYLRNG